MDFLEWLGLRCVSGFHGLSPGLDIRPPVHGHHASSRCRMDIPVMLDMIAPGIPAGLDARFT